MDNSKTTGSLLTASEWNELADMFIESMRIPKVSTEQRLGLTPDSGMIVYDTDLNLFYFYQNGVWTTMGGSGGFSGKLSDLDVDTSKNWSNYDILGLGNLVSDQDNSKDLGTTSKYWKDIYQKGEFFHKASSPTNVVLESMVDGPYAHFKLRADGFLYWGIASDPFDTFLYRNAVGELKTDGGFLAKYLKVFDGAGNYIQIPSMTEANLPASPYNGMICYNTTDEKFNFYQNGLWTEINVGGGGFSGKLSDLEIDDDKSWNNKSISGLADLIPDSDNTKKLGSLTKMWNNLYLKGYIWIRGSGTNMVLTVEDGSQYSRFNLDSDGDVLWGSGSAPLDITLGRRSGVLVLDSAFDTKSLKINGTEVLSNLRVLENVASLSFSPIPTANEGYNLGSLTNKWNNIYGKTFLSSLQIDADKDFNQKSISNIGDIIPYSISASDLGSQAHQFCYAWFEGWRASVPDLSILMIGIKLMADTYNRFQMYPDGGMYWGSGASDVLDVNLYRSAANILKTDDNFDAFSLKIGGSEVLSSARILHNIAGIDQDFKPNVSATYTLGDSTKFWKRLHLKSTGTDMVIDVQDSNQYSRLNVDADGKIYFGSGAVPLDANLYRSAVDVLKTDDSFNCLALQIGGTQVISSAKVLSGVTADANIITSGSFNISNRLTIDSDKDMNSKSLTNLKSLWLIGASGDASLDIKTTGDGFARFYADHSGTIAWGSGAGPVDVSLYRGSADYLKTSDSFECLALYINGSGPVINANRVLGNLQDLKLPATAYGTPTTGSSWFEAATGKLWIYNGSAWKYVTLS